MAKSDKDVEAAQRLSRDAGMWRARAAKAPEGSRLRGQNLRNAENAERKIQDLFVADSD